MIKMTLVNIVIVNKIIFVKMIKKQYSLLSGEILMIEKLFEGFCFL